MKFRRAGIVHRERFGNHALLRYRWEEQPPEPGQFVMTYAGQCGFDPFLPRPFFVHDYVDGIVSLLFEVRGRGTRLLSEEQPEILVSAPLGNGFTLVGEPVALVGGGVWVSPLKFLSRRLAAADISHDLYLEAPSDAPGAYIEWISENFPGAALVPTNGTVEAPMEILNSAGDLSRYCALYVSGTSKMLTAARNASVDKVPAQLAVRERMACANGSCHGCAIPVWRAGERTYARACVDGPVFEGETLAW